MDNKTIQMSSRGIQRSYRCLSLAPNVNITLKGRLLRIGEIFDEHWLLSTEAWSLPVIIAELQKLPIRPDIMTYTQKLPHIRPLYPFYYEWTNLAVLSIDSYKDWLVKRVDRMVRKGIRKSEREGVRSDILPFSDSFVSGICSIYNEVPYRQGKRFWHYGKNFETVKNENSTYLDRSVFIGAYFEDELVGFLKLVLDGETASIMQVLSKVKYFDKRPNNSLFAKAVETCENMKVKQLIYGQYTYGAYRQSSLTEFKKNLGFREVYIPQFYVPLTLLGGISLKLKLHKGLSNLLPPAVTAALIQLRERRISSK